MKVLLQRGLKLARLGFKKGGEMEDTSLVEITREMERVGRALSKLGFPEFVTALKVVIKEYGGGDNLKLLIDGLEIQLTPSVFVKGSDALTILEKVATIYPFSRWLTEQGIETSKATRFHICQWWDVLIMMAAEYGYVPGQIDQITRSANLWKATGPLAAKMQKDPPRYRFLPALLINHPQEVSRVLEQINEAQPFLEVLTGERMEDMRKSEPFLGAFSIVRDEEGGITRTIADALFSVQLILQRK